MRPSLLRVISGLIKVLLILGFAFNQFAYTLIVGFGWPFKKPLPLTGCIMETQEYGWPLSFYEVTTNCGMCCDGVSVPFSSFYFSHLVTDVIYLAGLALVSFYTAKVILYMLRKAVKIFRG